MSEMALEGKIDGKLFGERFIYALQQRVREIPDNHVSDLMAGISSIVVRNRLRLSSPDDWARGSSVPDRRVMRELGAILQVDEIWLEFGRRETKR